MVGIQLLRYCVARAHLQAGAAQMRFFSAMDAAISLARARRQGCL
jgi:hypothetical protein